MAAMIRIRHEWSCRQPDDPNLIAGNSLLFLMSSGKDSVEMLLLRRNTENPGNQNIGDLRRSLDTAVSAPGAANESFSRLAISSHFVSLSRSGGQYRKISQDRRNRFSLPFFP
jgi:hypothetical protein